MSVIEYLRGTKGELKHVNWPSKKQAVNYTAIVIGIALLLAVFLGGFDLLFTFILEQLV